MMILMRYPPVRPHAEPGPFPTSTSFLTGEQSDSGTDGQVDYKRTKDVSSSHSELSNAVLSWSRRDFTQKQYLTAPPSIMKPLPVPSSWSQLGRPCANIGPIKESCLEGLTCTFSCPNPYGDRPSPASPSRGPCQSSQLQCILNRHQLFILGGRGAGRYWLRG